MRSKRRVLAWLVGLAAILALTIAVRDRIRDQRSTAERETARLRQAEQLQQHREAQRATPVLPSLQPELLAVAPVPASDPAPTSPPYWTAFRGPARDGHYREQPVRTAWPAEGLRPIWKQPIGGGHASFAIAQNRAFTHEQRGNQEVVAAYDVATGRELWTAGWEAAFSEAYGGDGPRATPTWHDGTVFALGATGELRALDAASGQQQWRTNILEDAGASNLDWGVSASPLVVDDVVVVLPGGRNGRSVLAYDRRSGKQVWSALDDAAAYATPMLTTIAGVQQILVFAASRLVGLSVDGGRLLWEYEWPTHGGVNVAQPIVLDQARVFLSAGYGMGAALLRLTRAGDRFNVEEAWRSPRMKNQFTSSVYLDGYIYGLDESILACIDAATGELAWKGGRYGYGQLLLASGHLIVVTEEGELVLVRATAERHTEIARSPALAGRTWNHPAMAGGYLLVRNAAEMAAFDLRVTK
jgi:outer membrane protein assembly factor BamB